MTLTHYVAHLTLGVLIFAGITGKTEFNSMNIEISIPPIFTVSYATVFFVLSVIFTVLWSKKFRNGPLETLMRKISG